MKVKDVNDAGVAEAEGQVHAALDALGCSENDLRGKIFW